MIHCQHISKSYHTNSQIISIYKDLDRSVASGSSVAIMGPSGSGKSTLLNMLSGLDVPDAGTITIGDTCVSALSDDQRSHWRARHVGFIFQQFHLIPNLTVADNIDLVLDISGVARRSTTAAMLAKVGLAGYEQRYPSQLSGGEQQRVAIARAFIGELPLLLANEPTGNLDHANALLIMDLMMSLHKQTGTTIVLITHDPQVAAYATTQYTLKDGKLI